MLTSKRLSPRIESLERRQLMSVTTATIFAENFEHGGAGWTNNVDNSTDARPAWTIGPGMSGFGVHSGSKCASTTGPGTDCDLASPAINLPAVNQYADHLYLKFWADIKSTPGRGITYVEARQWIPLLGTYGPWNVIEPNAGPLPLNSGGWHYFGIDATLFAGSRVQFGFHQYGMNKWAVDDVSVTEQQIPHGWVGNESFNSGFDGWYGDNGTWNVASGYAGTGVGSTPPIGESILWSPAFYMPSTSSAVLKFQSWSSQMYGSLKNVVYSYWWPSTGWSPYMVSGEPIFAGKTNAWESMSVDLSGTIASAHIVPMRVGFYYDNVSGGGNWDITNVQLVTHATASAPLFSSNPITASSDGMTSDQIVDADLLLDSLKG